MCGFFLLFSVTSFLKMEQAIRVSIQVFCGVKHLGKEVVTCFKIDECAWDLVHIS